MKTLLSVALAAIGCASTAAAETTTNRTKDLAARGAYLARVMICADCHSGRGPTGEIDPDRHLTGATVGFEIPGLGTFWPPNLTSDPTGLGEWTDEEVLAAIRTGVRPDGRELAPAMPSALYSALSDEDGAALVAYLRSLPPAASAVPGPLGPGEPAPLPFYRVTLPAGASTN